VWAANESLFAAAGEDAEYAAAVSFLADHFGADSDVDSQGRVLMPQELRKALELENQPVWLKCFNGRISVYSKSVYEEELRTARVRASEGVKALEKRGLK
jgi:DNA-binding transcriptional regulator/RsmH inhibitor MraZ